MFEPEFLSMMPHTVTVSRQSGIDVYGNRVFGTVTPPTTYRCRIVGKILSLRRGDREELTTVYDVYTDMGDDVMTTDDQITLNGDPAWIDQTPEIFAVSRVTDEDGHHHTKIQCGWQYHRQGQ